MPVKNALKEIQHNAHALNTHGKPASAQNMLSLCCLFRVWCSNLTAQAASNRQKNFAFGKFSFDCVLTLTFFHKK